MFIEIPQKTTVDSKKNYSRRQKKKAKYKTTYAI